MLITITQALNLIKVWLIRGERQKMPMHAVAVFCAVLRQRYRAFGF